MAVLEYSLIIDLSWGNHIVRSIRSPTKCSCLWMSILRMQQHFVIMYYVLYMRTTPLSVSQKREGQVDVFCSIDDEVEKHVNWSPSLCCMISPRPPLISYGTLHSSCWFILLPPKLEVCFIYPFLSWHLCTTNRIYVFLAKIYKVKTVLLKC